MSELLNQIKSAILSSEQLLEKSKSFEEFCGKYQGKDYDDFSFTVSDTFNVKVTTRNGSYKLNVPPAIENDEKLKYQAFVETSLESLTFDTSHLDFGLSIGAKNDYDLKVIISIRIKYSSDNDEFIIQKMNDSRIDVYQNDINGYWKIISSSILPDSENYYQGVIGYTEDESSAKEIIVKLIETKAYFDQLDSKIKEELLDVIHDCRRFHSSYRDPSISFDELKLRLSVILDTDDFIFTEESNKINNEALGFVEHWLDKSCKSELRKLIRANHYNSYFSDKENWLSPVLYLSNDYEFSLKKC